MKRTGSEKGIALLMVLWVLTTLMVIVLSFSFTTRTETNATLAFKEGIEKRFLAEAGMERGITEIFYRNTFGTQNVNLEGLEVWKTDGTPYEGKIGNGSYSVKIMDESGKIDINTAPELLLRSFLFNFGLKDNVVDTVVDSIMDWKDADDLTRLHGAESDYYSSLNPPYKAKNANFDTVEELLLVKGVTRELLYGNSEKKGIIDFITVNSKRNQINISAAPKEVLMAVPGITPEIADDIISKRETQPANTPLNVTIPPEGLPYVTTGNSTTYTIEAVGYNDDKKGGYAIKATVVIEGNNKYRYVYYKSPFTITE